MPPPGWDAFPRGSLPPSDWSPDPGWPTEPEGWVFYVDELSYRVPTPDGAWDPKSPRVNTAKLDSGTGSAEEPGANNSTDGPPSVAGVRTRLILVLACLLALAGAMLLATPRLQPMDGDDFLRLAGNGSFGGKKSSGPAYVAVGYQGYDFGDTLSTECDSDYKFVGEELRAESQSVSDEGEALAGLQLWASPTAARESVPRYLACNPQVDVEVREWVSGPANVTQRSSSVGSELTVRIQNVTWTFYALPISADPADIADACIEEYKAALR